MSIKALKFWWEVWDIQVITLSSLLLQIVLIFSAPLRKRISNAVIVFPMWLSYLLADAIPIYAMGLISRRKSSNCQDGVAIVSNDLAVFWAAFLLLHLGGPDTVTAFALEDNELWHRHLLNLVVQCAIFLYAFIHTLPGNKLWLATVLIFIAGFIKYTERICSLYRASYRGLVNSMLPSPDPGPNYAELMKEYASKRKLGFQVGMDLRPDPPNTLPNTEDREEETSLSDLEAIRRAHRFHRIFKGLIADLSFSFRERSVNRHYFLKRNARDAFKIVEVELNFFYEILYTKVSVVQGMFGFPLRIASFGLNCTALLLFILMDKHKEGYKGFNVGLTYTLLGAAIALDAVSFLMNIFSDWSAVVASEYMNSKSILKLLNNIFRVERQRWPRIMQTVQHSWSESISQYNLIDYCLRPRSAKVEFSISLIGLGNIFDSIKYVKSKDFSHDLRDVIFYELKRKSDMAEDFESVRKISSARGNWILQFESCDNLLPWIENVDYDESILLWHIATELLYNTDDVAPKTDGCGSRTEIGYKGLSKILSDYMLYLLIMHPTIMSTVAGIVRIRYMDTCAEAKEFFLSQSSILQADEMKFCCPGVFCYGNCFRKSNLGATRGNTSSSEKCCGGCREETKDQVLEACKSIFSVETAIKPAAVKGDRSKSVLFDACMLAKELNKLEAHKTKDKEGENGENIEEEETIDKWRLICKVWIEMMCYAACHCKGTTHAAQLSKGGQLITLVWLLMAHLGLGDYFQIGGELERAKLTVG